MLPSEHNQEDIYQLGLAHKYPIKPPQPSQQAQPEYQYKASPSDKYSSSNSVLRSNDAIASFGLSPKNAFQKNSSYFLKRMGMSEEQLNQAHKKQFAYEPSNTSKNLFEAIKDTTPHNIGKNPKKKSSLYDFLYKLTGIVTCHVRTASRIALLHIRKYETDNNIMYDDDSSKVTAEYNIPEFNENPLQSSSKQHTKIQRLNSGQIDIESATDQQLYQDITGTKQFDLSINSQPKSQQKHGEPANKKKQVFGYNNRHYKQYFNKSDKNQEGGFVGIVNNKMTSSYDIKKNTKNDAENNEEAKRESISDIKKPQRDNKDKNAVSEKKVSEIRPKSKLGTNLERAISGEGSLSIIIREKSKHYNEKDSSNSHFPEWLKTNIIETPIQIELRQLPQSQTVTQSLYHLNPDTFKDSTPDFYQPASSTITHIQPNNTSLQIQLAIRNNSSSDHNQRSQNRYSHHDINSPNSNGQMIQQLQNTGHGIAQEQIQRDSGTSRILSCFTNQKSEGDKKKVQGQAKNNIVIRQYSGINNDYNSIVQPQRNSLLNRNEQPTSSYIRPKSLTMNNHVNPSQIVSMQKTQIHQIKDGNNQYHIRREPIVQQPSQNKLIRFNQSPQPSMLSYPKINRPLSHDQFQNNQCLHQFNHKSPINKQPQINFQHNNIKINRQYKANQANFTPTNSKPYFFYHSPSPNMGPQPYMNPNETATNLKKVNSDKKLPIFYGMRSPNYHSPDISHIQNTRNKNQQNISNQYYKMNTQQRFPMKSPQNHQQDWQAGQQKTITTKNESDLKNQVNSPKLNEKQRKSSQRILVYSSKKYKKY